LEMDLPPVDLTLVSDEENESPASTPAASRRGKPLQKAKKRILKGTPTPLSGSPIAEAFKRMRKGADVDDADEGEAATLAERDAAWRHDVNGTAGVITLVQMENFMCHRKFEIAMVRPCVHARCFEYSRAPANHVLLWRVCRGQHPNITFIVGENGSGKSAVFAAIQVSAAGAAVVGVFASTRLLCIMCFRSVSEPVLE
jgi:hypothetical protein